MLKFSWASQVSDYILVYCFLSLHDWPWAPWSQETAGPTYKYGTNSCPAPTSNPAFLRDSFLYTTSISLLMLGTFMLLHHSSIRLYPAVTFYVIVMSFAVPNYFFVLRRFFFRVFCVKGTTCQPHPHQQRGEGEGRCPDSPHSTACAFRVRPARNGLALSRHGAGTYHTEYLVSINCTVSYRYLHIHITV